MSEPATGAPRGLLLAGLMGSGKSSVGRAVADRRGWPYLDNDLEIAQLAGVTTVELAARGGDELHRWEAAYAADLAPRPGPFVAGLPGSTADHGDELRRLRKRHVLVYLRCDVATLVRRVAADPPRPWLASGDAEAFVRASYAHRDPVLAAVAEHVVDAGAPLPDVVADVLALLEPCHG